MFSENIILLPNLRNFYEFIFKNYLYIFQNITK